MTYIFIQPVFELSSELNTGINGEQSPPRVQSLSFETLPKLIYCLDVAHPQLWRHWSPHNIWLLLFFS